MTSEPKDLVKPIRSGRMKGVVIPIDAETWEYTLTRANIPLDTPVSQLRIRRYGASGGRIILKVFVEVESKSQNLRGSQRPKNSILFDKQEVGHASK